MVGFPERKRPFRLHNPEVFLKFELKARYSTDLQASLHPVTKSWAALVILNDATIVQGGSIAANLKLVCWQ